MAQKPRTGLRMILHVNGTGTYGPHSKIGPACWPHYDLFVLLEGNLKLNLGKMHLSLFAHDAVFIPPGTAFV